MKNCLLEIAKQIVNEYIMEEFEDESGADFSNLSDIRVAYTTTEDDLHEIQAVVNLTENRIEIYVDNTLARSVQYDGIEDFIENGLKNLSFDSLVYLSEEEIEQLENNFY